jgi:chemotaxis protein MotB
MKAKKSAPAIRPPSRKGPKHHGGSWKVAYADFVTAMMAFFLLMWILNIVPKDVQKALEGYFKTGSKPGHFIEDPNAPPGGSPETVPQKLTEEQAARYAIAMRFKKIITEDPFLKQSSGVSSDDTGVLLRVNNDLMFKPGSAEMTPEAAKVVKEVQEVLRAFNLYLMVRGHSLPGEYKGGSFPSNWELSGARAGAVARAVLSDKAIAPNRIRAVSYGDTMPLAPPLSPESEALNRRVEFYFHRPDVMNYRVVN